MLVDDYFDSVDNCMRVPNRSAQSIVVVGAGTSGAHGYVNCSIKKACQSLSLGQEVQVRPFTHRCDRLVCRKSNIVGSRWRAEAVRRHRGRVRRRRQEFDVKSMTAFAETASGCPAAAAGPPLFLFRLSAPSHTCARAPSYGIRAHTRVCHRGEKVTESAVLLLCGTVQ